jgi:tripartite-type tricarboxylate transporter receptor subunit TctC
MRAAQWPLRHRTSAQSAERSRAHFVAMPHNFTASPPLRTACAFVAVACALVATAAGAQSLETHAYPKHPVRIFVGQSAGAAPDIVARALADALARRWGEAVVVENRSGASGTIAAELVAKSPPDGYTLLFAGQSALVTAAANGTSRRYDPATDFAPIGRVVKVPVFIAAGAHVEAGTLPELIALARAHPGRVTFASYGEGAVSEVAFVLLQRGAGISLTEVPYRGTSQAMTDLVAGRVDLTLKDLGSGRPFIDSGKLRLLATTGANRSPFAPEIPTVAEAGVPGYALDFWYGLLAPAGLPPDVLASLVAALDGALRSPALAKRLAELSYEPMHDGPAQFAALMRADVLTFSRAAHGPAPAVPRPAAH